MRGAAAALFLGLLVIAVQLIGCGPEEPEGTALWFSSGRTDWLSSEVSAVVREARGADGVELTLQIDVRHRETGENLTFLLLAPALEGSHPVQVFGRLAGWDSEKGFERLLPVSSACSDAQSSTLTIEEIDSQARTLEGSFLVNVCGVESDHAWTLGEGRFQSVPY